MHEDFRSLLADDGAVSGYVSTRIYWNALPQAVDDPCIVLYEIDALPSYTMAGQDELVPYRVQADVRAQTYTSALTVARALRAALSGYKGTKGATFFGAVFQLNGRAYSQKPNTVLYHVVSTDFEVWASPAP